MGQAGREKLTRREREVLAFLGEGRTNRQIARSLFVDVRTAEFHVANVLAKLGLESRAQVVAYLARNNAETQSPYHNLPASLSSFIGRESDVASVRSLVQRLRLVTVTGAGGIGKTRLALEVARGVDPPCRDGVQFVDLAPLRDLDLIVSTFLSTFGLREDPSRSREETLISALRSRELLVVVDNCEHLLGGVARLIRRILGYCPTVRVLATSRAPLGVDGESIYSLGGLAIVSESGLDGQFDADSHRLFLDRAQLARPGFEPTLQDLQEIAAICRVLDGMPLGIELAAARLMGMSPSEIRAQIEHGKTLSTSSKAVPDRHKTVDAAIGWSYSLLDEPMQAVFRRLSVCAGFNLEAAQAIAAAPPVGGEDVSEIVQSLVENSLVVAQQLGASTRYRLLEPVRQYAGHALAEACEATATRRRHAEYFAAIGERACPDLVKAPGESWVHLIETELDNLRIALGWAVDNDAVLEVRLVKPLQKFWSVRVQLAETKQAVLHGLSRTRERSRDRVQMLWASSSIHNRLGEAREALHLAEASLALARELGLRSDQVLALQGLASAQYVMNLPAAGPTFQQAASLARELGDPWLIGKALETLGLWLVQHDHWSSAHGVLKEAEALLRNTGDLWLQQSVLQTQGVLAFGEKQDELAAQCWFEVLRIGRQLGDRYQVDEALDGLAQLSIKKGDAARGLRLAGAAAAIRLATAIVTKSDHPYLDQWLAHGRRLLRRQDADRAWMEGMQMSDNEAIRYALETSSAAAPVHA